MEKNYILSHSITDAAYSMPREQFLKLINFLCFSSLSSLIFSFLSRLHAKLQCQWQKVSFEATALLAGLGTWRWRSLQTLFREFDRRNDQNSKISHNSSPNSLPVCLTVSAKWHFVRQSPRPMLLCLCSTGISSVLVIQWLHRHKHTWTASTA